MRTGGTRTSSPSDEPGVGVGPTLVDPDFARADDAVDVGLRHALEQLDEEVVEALAGRILADEDAGDGRNRRCRGLAGGGHPSPGAFAPL